MCIRDRAGSGAPPPRTGRRWRGKFSSCGSFSLSCRLNVWEKNPLGSAIVPWDAARRPGALTSTRFPCGVPPPKRPDFPTRVSNAMHAYRTHTCGALRSDDVGKTVRLSGWVHRIRDHGGLLFVDLRDHYGLTQIVADPDSPVFAAAEKLKPEWVVRI